jgi:hypothetical protein
MVASVASANEDDGSRSSCGALESTGEHKYCAIAGLGGTAHGDGDDDGEPSSNAYRSTMKSAADHENCATASLGCNANAHGDGDSEPNSSAAMDTSPAWMADASFLHPRLVRHLLLKMAWRGSGKRTMGSKGHPNLATATVQQVLLINLPPLLPSSLS